LILRFYFTMVLGRYLHIFFLFPWPINYNHAFQCNKSSTHSLPIDFDWKFLFFSLKLWHMATSYKLQTAQVNEEPTLGSTLDLTFDATSSWWRSQTARGAHSSWSWSPSRLILSHFFEFSHLGDFVVSRPCF
jgi:hypothetical protein